MSNLFALVTGGTKGLGKSIIYALSEKGYNVAFCSRSLQDGIDLKSNLEMEFPKLKFYFKKCDVTSKTEIDEFLTALFKDFNNKIDILVNNAGVFLPGNVLDEEDSQLPFQIETNLYSAYYFTKPIAKGMIANKAGHIFNMCSVASLKAYPNGGSYSISKFALHGFSKVLREELKPHNVKVTSIFPGATWSDSWKGVDLPRERLMEPEDIAKLVVCSLDLSPAATLEDIIVRPQLGDL
ncbi:MAG TPA: SDR family oxidoreductase [Saprospiraceae bacterium]|nr:SDR family oxidoreductase [Saprospiraceae bacterium]